MVCVVSFWSVEPRVERHLQRSELAGAERVIDRLAPASERVGRAHDPLDRVLAGDLRGQVEAVDAFGGPALPERLVSAGVRADELELSEPERREVGAFGRDAGDHDAAARTRDAKGEVERAP